MRWEIDVDSFEVRKDSGCIKPLTDADRAEMKILRERILHG
jgi:hypothetical protein